MGPRPKGGYRQYPRSVHRRSRARHGARPAHRVPGERARPLPQSECCCWQFSGDLLSVESARSSMTPVFCPFFLCFAEGAPLGRVQGGVPWGRPLLVMLARVGRTGRTGPNTAQRGAAAATAPARVLLLAFGVHSTRQSRARAQHSLAARGMTAGARARAQSATEGVVAPRAHRVRTVATVGGRTPVHHPQPKRSIEPWKSSVVSRRPVFLGFFLWLPINPSGFWVVFVLSGRPLEGCNHHREGPQIYPKLTSRAHRSKSALMGLSCAHVVSTVSVDHNRARQTRAYL